MSCENSTATNDKSALQLYSIKLGFSWVFGYKFYSDRSKNIPLDVSDMQFELHIYRQDKSEALVISNTDWERPEIHRIQKRYDPITDSVLPVGEYTSELIGIYPDGKKLPFVNGPIIVY